MKPSDFELSISIESYNEKNVENDRNCYVADKRIVSKSSEISTQNLNSTIEGNMPLKIVSEGSGRFVLRCTGLILTIYFKGLTA